MYIKKIQMKTNHDFFILCSKYLKRISKTNISALKFFYSFLCMSRTFPGKRIHFQQSIKYLMRNSSFKACTLLKFLLRKRGAFNKKKKERKNKNLEK